MRQVTLVWSFRGKRTDEMQQARERYGIQMWGYISKGLVPSDKFEAAEFTVEALGGRPQ